MKLGLHVPDFTWPGGPARLRDTLAQIGKTADQGGFTSISVMDHFFQIGMIGPPEREMLEGYAALAFLAGHTTRAQLGTVVTGVVDAPTWAASPTRGRCDCGTAWNGCGASGPVTCSSFRRTTRAKLSAGRIGLSRRGST